MFLPDMLSHLNSSNTTFHIYEGFLISSLKNGMYMAPAKSLQLDHSNLISTLFLFFLIIYIPLYEEYHLENAS